MFLKTSTAMAVAVVLSACGGGGGGGSSSGTTAPIASLSSTNYTTVSNSAAAAVADAGASSSLAKVASVGGTASATPASTSAGVYEIAQYAVSQLRAGPLLDTAQAVSNSSVNCAYSGTAAVSVNDANNNSVFDAGDSATLSFSNCSFAAGQAAVSGAMTLAVTSLTSNGKTLTAGVFSISFNNMTSGSARLSGTMGFSFSPTLATLSYSNFTASRGGNSATYGYTATVDTSTTPTKVSLSGPITVGGSSYTISTVTPLTYTGAYASAGLLRVSDAAGNHADITPSGTQFSVSYYAVGSSVASSSYTTSWSSIL